MAPIVEYLKAENEVLRSMLPKQIRVPPADRKKLLELGQWFRDPKARPKGKSKCIGRPKTDENLEDLVPRIRAETG